MQFSAIFLLFLSAFAGYSCASKDRNNKNHKIVCYYGSWGVWRINNGHYEPESANPFLCTHMMYGFAILQTDNTIGVYEPEVDIDKQFYQRFINLRKVNPHLTQMISIGGWNEGSDKYSLMVNNPSARKTFVASVLKFLAEKGFDGLDLDWEYPGTKATKNETRKPGNPADKDAFSKLVTELHDAFQKDGYVLSAALSAGKPTIDRAYDAKTLNEKLNFLNIMTYDFHGAWENHTGHNAPLHSLPGANELDKEFTVEYAIDYWIKLGVDPKKMTMGIPLYGRTFTLTNAAKIEIGAEAVGDGGTAGPFSQQPGTLFYHEICTLLKAGNWKLHRDDVEKVPYATRGNQWIGYDDPQSIREKLKFLRSKNLGGATIWTIDSDDFNNQCGHGKYPLLKPIAKDLINADTTDPVITGPTQKPLGDGFPCTKAGYFPDPKDTTEYHWCYDGGNGQLISATMHCPNGTHFDKTTSACD